MIGAQASRQQYDKILSYIDIAREEGGQILTGGERRADRTRSWTTASTCSRPCSRATTRCACFQEEIFGPVASASPPSTMRPKALAIANDTQFGLGAGRLDARHQPRPYRMGRGIKAGRVWTNCYHLYPAHAAFGGYKKSGVGRETHKMALSRTISRPKTCWSAMAQRHWGCSKSASVQMESER